MARSSWGFSKTQRAPLGDPVRSGALFLGIQWDLARHSWGWVRPGALSLRIHQDPTLKVLLSVLLKIARIARRSAFLGAIFGRFGLMGGPTGQGSWIPGSGPTFRAYLDPKFRAYKSRFRSKSCPRFYSELHSQFYSEVYSQFYSQFYSKFQES
jgi:hypothetical protein